MFKTFFPGMVIVALACAHAEAAEPEPLQLALSPVSRSLASPRPARADFGEQAAPVDARRMADWVVASADNGRLPFVIVDKRDAEVFVFDRRGHILGAAPALLGLAVGDESAPGVGNKRLSAIPPKDRTTPAGRFVAYLGRESANAITLWVDFRDNIALHRVIKGRPKDHRLERLATPTPLDNRITFGCINVPVAFFDRTVLHTFKHSKGIVYILPEIKATRDVFPSYYDVDE
jgi:hypothetical protein